MLTIIGCGNLNRSDDGVGVRLVQELRRRLSSRPPRDDVRLFDAGTSGFEVMFQARGSDALVLVDACRSGSDAGAVFEVPGDKLEGQAPAGANLHAFRWDHALYAGRKIFGATFPTEVTVILVEAKELGLGLELSPEVEAASAHVLRRLEELVDAHRGGGVALEVTLGGGSVYLEASVYEAHFGGTEMVALLLEEEELNLVPIRAGAGLLVKRRNARGDRVVHAIEALRVRGFDGADPVSLPARWDPDRAALVVDLRPLRRRETT